jgi:hypothetical protein
MGTTTDVRPGTARIHAAADARADVVDAVLEDVGSAPLPWPATATVMVVALASVAVRVIAGV